MAHSVWTGGSRHPGRAALPHENIQETLKDYKVPPVVVDFYAQYEPKDIPMTNAGIYLLDLRCFFAP